MRTQYGLAVLGCLLLTIPAIAGDQESDGAAPDAYQRVEQLEAETRALRAEIEAYQRRVERLPPVSTPSEAGENLTADAPLGEANSVGREEEPRLAALPQEAPRPQAAAEPPPVTREQATAEIKKLAWSKGDWKVVPYGILWGSMVYESQRTSPGEFPIYVQSPSIINHAGFFADAKSTRLGLDVSGPSLAWLCDAKLAGRAEFDFQRTFDTSNRAGVLFRQGYVEAKTEQWRLLFGQAWEVISPLYPGSIMYIPGSGAGNVGYRRAQFRGERFLAFSDVNLTTLQLSLNSNIISDFTSDPLIVGREAGWPVVEGRAAITLGERTGPDAIPMTFGVSGHIGAQEFDFPPPLPNPVFGETARTWSLNADLRIPFTKRFGFQGEFFTGENLGAYMGGILQGIDRVSRQPIRSTGGWAELWHDWRPDLHSHVGYSIDDPVNSDVSAGGRIYNDFWFANVIYDFTKFFNVGFEASYWKTHWVGLLPGDSFRFEMAARYNF